MCTIEKWAALSGYTVTHRKKESMEVLGNEVVVKLAQGVRANLIKSFEGWIDRWRTWVDRRLKNEI